MKKLLLFTGAVLSIFIGVMTLNYNVEQGNLGAFSNRQETPTGASFPLSSTFEPTEITGTPEEFGANVILNNSFEDWTGDLPTSFVSSSIDGAGTIIVTTTARTGTSSVYITGEVVTPNISGLEGQAFSGLTPSVSYVVSGYQRNTGTDNSFGTVVMFNAATVASSTQIYSFASSTWDTFTDWSTTLGGDPTRYAIPSSATTTFANFIDLVTVPASGTLLPFFVGFPGDGEMETTISVLMDDVSLQSYTAAVPTTYSAVTLFGFSNPSDAAELGSSSIISVSTTGGTPREWLRMDGDGELDAYGFSASTTYNPDNSVVVSDNGDLKGTSDLTFDGTSFSLWTNAFSFKSSGRLLMTRAVAASVGNVTLSAPFGVVYAAPSIGSIEVTNSLVTATSTIFAIAQTNDTFAVKNVVPTTGSFTITSAAAATATTTVAFWIIN